MPDTQYFEPSRQPPETLEEAYRAVITPAACHGHPGKLLTCLTSIRAQEFTRLHSCQVSKSSEVVPFQPRPTASAPPLTKERRHGKEDRAPMRTACSLWYDHLYIFACQGFGQGHIVIADVHSPLFGSDDVARR